MAALLLPLLVTTGCRRRHFPRHPAGYREYAWVTNGGSNTVTALDLVNMTTAATIGVGDDPTAIAVNPARNELYVANSGSGTVSVIDAERNRVSLTIGVHRDPTAIAVDASGDRAWVTNAGSNNLSLIDLRRRREIAAVGVGESPAMVRIAPDGNTLVVTNRGAGSLSVLDAKTLKVRSVFPGCPGASDAVILPDSSKAFAACTGGHQVMVVSLARPVSPASPAGAIAGDRADHLLDLLDVGPSPTHLAMKPDGGEIFVENSGGDTISEIATNADDVGGAYVVGASPSSGVVTADNSTLWVSNFGANTVAAYSIDDGTLVNKGIGVGDGPGPLALTDSGFLLLAVDQKSGDVSVLRTISYTPKGEPVTGSLFTVLSAGKHPNAIATKSFSVK